VLFDCISDQTASSATATAATDTASAGESDSSRSWAWHQPAGNQSDGTTTSGGGAASGGVVVYQLPAPATSDAPATTFGSDGQPTCYYSVDAFGQIIQQQDSSAASNAAVTASTSGQTAATTTSLRNSQLELEVLHLQTALDEKSREVDSLRAQLAEAYATVERLKCEPSANNESISAPPAASTPSAVLPAAGDQSSVASDSVLAADMQATPSPS